MEHPYDDNNFTKRKKLVAALAATLLPLAPTTALADWTGNYAGISLGQLTTGEISPEFEGDTFDLDVESDAIVSAFYGYQVQRGDLVFGGEAAFSARSDAEISFEDAGDDTFDSEISFIDLKARAGYAFDTALIYGVAGVSRGTATVVPGIDVTADGFNFGFGADYMISDQFVIGAEYLARRLNEDDFIGEGIDIDTTADTIAIRASFKF